MTQPPLKVLQIDQADLSAFINAQVGETVGSLSQLSDVTIDEPNPGEILSYGGSPIQWRNAPNALQFTAGDGIDSDALDGSPSQLAVNSTVARRDASNTFQQSNTFTAALISNSSAAVVMNSSAPGLIFDESGAAADNQIWRMFASGATLTFDIRNDAGSITNNWLTVGRSGATVGAIDFTGTSMTFNGVPIQVGSPQGAGGSGLGSPQFITGNLTASGVIRAGGYADPTVPTLAMDGTSGYEISVGVSAGGWARGLVPTKVSDGLRLGGAGFLGGNEIITSYHVGFNPSWWTTGSPINGNPLLTYENDGDLILFANKNTTHTLLIDNDSNGTTNAARLAISCGDGNGALFVAGSGRTGTLVTGGPTGRQTVLRTLDATHPLVLGTSNTQRIRIEDATTTFDNRILSSASTTTRAGLNIPAGTAPTTPVNGDVWSTTYGFLGATGSPQVVHPFSLGTAVKTSTETRTNTVTMTVDPELRVQATGPAQYFKVDIFLNIVSSGLGGLRWDVNVTGGSEVGTERRTTWYNIGEGSPTSTTRARHLVGQTSGASIITQTMGWNGVDTVEISYPLSLVSTNTPLIEFIFAQSDADAAGVSIGAGSYMVVTPLG